MNNDVILKHNIPFIKIDCNTCELLFSKINRDVNIKMLEKDGDYNLSIMINKPLPGDTSIIDITFHLKDNNKYLQLCITDLSVSNVPHNSYYILELNNDKISNLLRRFCKNLNNKIINLEDRSTFYIFMKKILKILMQHSVTKKEKLKEESCPTIIFCKEGVLCSDYDIEDRFQKIKNRKTIKISSQLLLYKFRSAVVHKEFPRFMLKIIDIDGKIYTSQTKCDHLGKFDCDILNTKILNKYDDYLDDIIFFIENSKEKVEENDG